jgi:protein gp37
MGENTKIEWAHHTFNPWVGCTKVSPACDNCYAEAWARRIGQAELWQGKRRRTTQANWRLAHKWNSRAGAACVRERVFCASLADVFDNQVAARWRDDLWHLIDQTPHLDWLLLTKRPQNIEPMLPDPRTGVRPWGDGWPNVWLGTTTENQAEADRRIPHLLGVPAAKHFISAEPLLGPLSLERRLVGEQRVDWIITGGESGPRARPAHPDWFRSLRDQCKAAGVSFFFKQWGEWKDGPSCGPDVERRVVSDDGYDGYRFSIMARIGKKAAGRLLDGVEHSEFPQ